MPFFDALLIGLRAKFARGLVRHRPRPASAFGGLFHDQNQRQAGGEHDRQKKEDIDIAHHGGLLLDQAEQSGSGLFGGGGASMPLAMKAAFIWAIMFCAENRRTPGTNDTFCSRQSGMRYYSNPRSFDIK